MTLAGIIADAKRELVKRLVLVRGEVVSAVRHVRPGAPVLLLWLVLVSGLAVLTGFAAGAEFFSWDLWLARKIQAIDLPGFTSATTLATDLSSANASVLWFLGSVVGLILLRQFRLAFFAAAAIWTHLIGGGLKLVVDRMRPSPELLERVSLEERLSYPSGHTEWVVGFEGFLVFAIWQLTANRFIRYTAAAAWAVHVALTGVGRIDQGLHWPSDVLAGLLVGALALSGTVWAYLASKRAAASAAEEATIPSPLVV